MDIKFIRDNQDLVKNNQEKRFLDPTVVDKIITLHDEWRTTQKYNSDMRSIKNRTTRAFRKAPPETVVELEVDFVSQLVSKNDIIKLLSKEQIKFLGAKLSAMITETDKKVKELIVERDALINELGNFLHMDAPISKNDDDVELIDTTNNSVKNSYPMSNKLLSHIDLLPKLAFVDIDRGIRIAGSRGYFFTGFGVKLNRALISYAMDFAAKNGYYEVETPFFMNNDVMGKVAQLSEYSESLYKLDGEDKYLIATSEQPMTAFYKGKKFKKEDLPKKLIGLSHCFRKETGAHGRNTRGIFRVHQFEKVEQFCVVDPDKSWDTFKEMMDTTKQFYDTLGISYRVVNIPSGSLNNSASMKYDLEAYFPGSKKYYELVSCTNCLDYFSRRLKIKCGDKLAHMLNCTMCANTRTVCCLAEIYQRDGGMEIPEVLRPYMGVDFVKFV